MDKTVWIYKRPHYAEDLAEAFIRLGCHAELRTEMEMMRGMGKGEHPDLVISNVAGQTLGLEHPKDAYTVLSMTAERKIPYAWLMWDSAFHSPALRTLEQQDGAVKAGLPRIRPMVYPEGDNLYVFTVSKEAVPHLKGKHVEYMPFGVNTERFCPMPLNKAYPVGFIGTSLIGQETDGVSVMEELGLTGEIDVGDVATAETWRIMCAVRTSAILRIESCGAVNADVWGDGWEQPVARGVVKWHGVAHWLDSLPEIINRTAINLNISKTCFPEDIAPRILELLACGAVVVSNSLPGLWREFGECAWFYQDPEHLKELVKQIGMEKAKAERMALAGRKLMESGWTWNRRVERILEVTGVL